MAECVGRALEKVPEMTELKAETQALTGQLASVKAQLELAFGAMIQTRDENRRLAAEKAEILNQKITIEASHQTLETQLETTASELTVTQQSLRVKAEEMEETRSNAEKTIDALREVISSNEAKLVRAREAIESLRKERTELTEKQSLLSQEIANLESENEHLKATQAASIAIQDQQTDMEWEKQLKETEQMKRLAEKKIVELESRLAENEQERRELQCHITALEVPSEADPPVHAADPQVVQQ